MKSRLTLSQPQGQASVEALLMIAFGFLLVLGIHHIGQLRSQTLHLLGESHFLSFAPKGKNDDRDLSVTSPTVKPASVSITLSNEEPLHDQYANIRLDDARYGESQLELGKQLGFDSAILLRASARSASTQQSALPTMGLNRQVQLIRHSFLLSGYGQTDSARAAQTKIAESAALWQESFLQSRQLANNSSTILQSIDQAWDRTALTSAWLVPWANESLVSATHGPTSSSQLAQTSEQILGGVSK
jgi:hypothetical protein